MTDLVLNVMELYPKEKAYPAIEKPEYSTTITCGHCGAEVRNVFNSTTRVGEISSVRCKAIDDIGRQCLNRFKVVVSEK